MSSKNKLMSALDDAAFKLLQRHFPEPKEGEEVKPPEPLDQIRAFQAVVTYYGPRTKLGVDEDKQTNGIDALRNKLHGRGKVGRRPRAAEGGANGAASAGDDPAGYA